MTSRQQQVRSHLMIQLHLADLHMQIRRAWWWWLP
jgi:hypothetical protein